MKEKDTMQQIINGVNKFQREVYPQSQQQFEALAKGQDPEVLFITCADSRIDPSLITQTKPGELFICRNAGNIVPPHSNETGGMTSSIEYAVAALNIKHIVICGHTDCGAMKGALALDKLQQMPHVKKWLGHCRSAAEVVREKKGELSSGCLDDLTRENVVQQLQHLRTHPAVAAKLATGQIELHGWIYNIETGEVLCYDQDKGAFCSASECYSEIMEGS